MQTMSRAKNKICISCNNKFKTTKQGSEFVCVWCCIDMGEFGDELKLLTDILKERNKQFELLMQK